MKKRSSWLLVFSVLFCLALLVFVGAYYALHPAGVSYLKWRFAGGDIDGLRQLCLSGQLDREQVIDLAGSGASLQVRMAALQCFTEKERFERPYSQDVVKAIAAFAKRPPFEAPEIDAWGTMLCYVMVSSPQDEFFPIIEGLAASEDPMIRSFAGAAFLVAYDYGEKGRLLLMKLLKDPIPMVRLNAMVGIAGVAQESEEKASDLLDQMRSSILDSATEEPRLRAGALRILWRHHRITRQEVEAFQKDRQPDVAQEAQKLLQ